MSRIHLTTNLDNPNCKTGFRANTTTKTPNVDKVWLSPVPVKNTEVARVDNPAPNTVEQLMKFHLLKFQ